MAGMTSSPSPSRVSPGVPAGGQFATQAHPEPDLHLVNVDEDTTAQRLTTETPEGIDTELAALVGVTARADAQLERAQDQAELVARLLAEATPGGYDAVYSYGPEVQQKAAAKVARCRTELDEAVAAEAPFHAEFTRRGGWNRAFLVTNAGGHVHTSTSCSTCFPRTSFVWLTEFSDRDEDEVVGAAGESACTTCFPSAPVDVLRRHSTIEAPARREARMQRETKAAAKAAKEEATGIANPDGSPLRGEWGVIKTERAAQIELVDIIASHRGYGYDAHLDVQDTIFAALAHKRGQDVDQVRLDVETKVVAKLKRDARA